MSTCDPSMLVGMLNELGLVKFLTKQYRHLSFKMSKGGSDVDMAGIDVIGYSLMGRIEYLAQAKSSLAGAIRFGTRYIDGVYVHVWYVDEDGEWREYE